MLFQRCEQRAAATVEGQRHFARLALADHLGRAAAPEVDGIAETELPGGPREDLPGASAGPVGVYRLVQGHLDAGGAAPAGKACRAPTGVVGFPQVPRAEGTRTNG